MSGTRLIIAETRTSNWHYHLRELAEGEEPQYGGLPWDTKALCEKTTLGWDTRILLESWGHSSGHLPESFCSDCSETYARRKSKEG